jgi:GcrA cell cycle regulator
MSWTDERIERLAKLWADGLSASQIAADLGGVTRNAVIGKVHRLGLSGRAKSPAPSSPKPRKVAPVTAQPSPASQQHQRPAARNVTTTVVRGNTAIQMQPVMEAEVVLMAEESVVVHLSRRVRIMELREGMCKWPIGDPTHEDFVYCGNDGGLGHSYCQHHAKIAYQPSAERRRDR